MRIKHSLLGLGALLLTTGPVQAAAATWARAYGENLHPPYVYARGAHAVIARNDEVFTIDAMGVPLRAAELEQRWHMAVGTKGEIFRADSKANILTVDRLEASLESGTGHRYAFPERLLVGALTAAADGGLFVVANERNASIVIRLAPDGATRWVRRLDPSGDEDLTSVVETRDGGCVVAGRRTGNAWIVKLDKSGGVVWHRNYAYYSGRFEGVLETRSGEIVVTGELGGKLAVVRFTSEGTPVWQKLYSEAGIGFSIAETSTGSFVIGGTGKSDWRPLVLLELKDDGAPGWKRRLASPKGNPLNLAMKNLIGVVKPSILVALPHRENDRRVIVTALDERTGASSCEWWTAIGGEWTDGKFAGEILLFETTTVAVTEVESPVTRKETAISTSIETCELPSTSAPVSEPAPKPAEFCARCLKLTELWLGLRKEKKFAELDAEAERLRRERTFDSPRWWDIDIFYRALVRPPGMSERDRIGELREWVALRPDSITAKIALAKTLISGAGERHGGGYADTVTELGWREDEEWTREALRTIDEIGARGEADPQYWMLRVALDFHVSGVDPRETARRASKLHHYPRLFSTAAMYVLPKWGGSAAAYLAFADEASRLTAPTFGEGMYTILAEIIRHEEDYERDFAPKIDWKRVRQGYRDLIAISPGWIPTYHAFAHRARLLHDRGLARELFSMPQLAWYDGADDEWKSKQAYDAVREWALSKPVEPFMELDREKWPPIVLQTQLVLSTGTHNRISAFLLETPSGIAAVSVVPEIANRPDSVSAVGEARRHLLKWLTWPAAQPKRRVEVSIAAVPTENAAQTTLLTFPASKTGPVHALKPAFTEWAPRDGFGARRRFVVGCSWTGDSCRQTVIEAEPQGGQGDFSGRPRAHLLGVRQAIPAESFIGGAVLDEDGRVVAVVKGMSPSFKPDISANLEADDLSMVLATSKTAPASFTESPHAKWPAIVMQSRIAPSSVKTGAFLVETPDGVVGVTVVPEKRTARLIENPIRKTWTVRPLTLRPLDQPLPLGGVVFMANRPFEPNCFVVGCVWTGGKCVQTVVEGKLIGGSPTQQVSLQAPPGDSLIGGAVLDRDGKVFAVVTGASSQRMGAELHLVDVELLSRVLAPD